MFNKIANNLLYLLALSPLLNIIAAAYFGITVIYIVAAISYFVLLLTVFEKQKIVFPYYLKAFFLFTLYATILNLVNTEFTFNINYWYNFSPMGFFIIALLIENTNITDQTIRGTLQAAKATLLVAFVVMIIQILINPMFLFNTRVIETSFDQIIWNERLTGIFSWTSQLSSGLDFIPLLAIVISTYSANSRNKVFSWLVLGLIFSFFTRSRWIVINYLSLFSIFVLQFRNMFSKNVISILAIVIFSFMALTLFDSYGVNVTDTIMNRFFEQDAGGLTKGGSSSRILAFEVFSKLFPKNPIWGVGLVLNDELISELGGRSSQIHVGYLALFYHYGLVGGFIYTIFLTSLMRKLYLTGKRINKWGAFLGWVGFILANFTLFYIGPYQMGLLVCLVFNKYYMQQLENSFAKLSK